MLAFLVLVFIVVPLIELYVIVQVAQWQGVGTTILLLLAVSIVGAWLVKREGLGIVARVQERMAAGEVPGKELGDGALVLFAGALMLTPGFVTDTIGLLLLIPPTRAMARVALGGLLARRVQVASFGMAPDATTFRQSWRDYGDVVDVDEVDDDEPPGAASGELH